MHNLCSAEGVNSTRKMACHFTDSDIMSGNNDVMADSSKSVGIKIFTNVKVIYSDIKSGTIFFHVKFASCQLMLLKFSKFLSFH